MDIKDIMTPNAVAAAEMTESQRVNSQHRRSAVVPESSIPQIAEESLFPSVIKWVVTHEGGGYMTSRLAPGLTRWNEWVFQRDITKAATYATKVNAEFAKTNNVAIAGRIRVVPVEITYVVGGGQ